MPSYLRRALTKVRDLVWDIRCDLEDHNNNYLYDLRQATAQAKEADDLMKAILQKQYGTEL